MVSLASAIGCGDGGATGGAGGHGTTAATTTSVTVSTTGAGGGGGAADGTLIMTDKGPVQGTIVGASRVFLGIPFAAPPIDALRWKPPQPHAAWTTAVDATMRKPACTQLGALSPTFDATSSEDCLTLNIWAPKTPPSTPVPVMVWIYGGSFSVGSAADKAYDGQKLAEMAGAIVVTINYRLGPLGFLAHPDLVAEDAAHPSSGMYGFEDQRMALAWTRDNIAAFGGDPTRVTAFGESAGGISTCLHLVSPLSTSLFARAIIESGGCSNLGAVTSAAAIAHGAQVVTALGCDGANPITCMRGKTAQQVVEAVPVTPFDLAHAWAPNIDGLNLPSAPAQLFANGAIANVPVLLGTNDDEGTLFLAIGNTVVDDATYLAFVDQFFPGKGSQVVAHYPSANFASPKEAAEEAIADAGFVCPARATARAIAKTGHPTFLYHFTHAPAALLPALGSYHSSELPFVFDNPGPLSPSSPTVAEAPLVATMQGYWTRMAKTGDPNGAGATPWPAFTEAGDQNIVLDLTVSAETNRKKVDCDFWDAF